MNQLNISGYPTADYDLAYLSTNPLVYLVAYLINVAIYISGSIEMSDKLWEKNVSYNKTTWKGEQEKIRKGSNTNRELCAA